MRYRGWVAFVGFIGLSASLLPCGSVFRPGQEAAMYYETALIAWNPNTKVEHFIRKAWFQGKGADFGFLIPTPSEPTLGESSDLVFQTMRGIEASRRPAQPGPGGFGGGAGAGSGGSGVVEVIKQQTVAGYKATVLKSDDATALTQWLDANGYPASQQIVDWALPYTQNHFYITALKIDRQTSAEGAATAAVRISFRTPVPFYPYREPNYPKRRDLTRTLKLYFLSDTSYAGVYSVNRKRWDATQFKAGKLSENETKAVLSQARLPEGSMPSGSKLTIFTDSTVVRPESDLFFLPDR